jgi:serine/threonine-protein kinase
LVAPLELGRLGAVVERAGRPDPDERYLDAVTMGAALADAARALPPPTPLALAGLDGEMNLADPTKIGRSSALFDQDAPLDPPPVDPIARPGRGNGAQRMVGAFVAVAVLLALAAGGAAIASTTGGGDTVGVPSLVGLASDQATTRLADAGLGIRVVTRPSDDPAGIVIAQSPVPGSFVGDGTTVKLVVSRGPPKVTVPDVANRTVDEATVALEQAGFVVTRTRRFDEGVPVDAVIGTDPTGGSAAPSESAITLIVSDGPAPVQVPDVVGRTYDEAAQALASQHLTATRVPDEFSSSVEAGKVIGTNPGAGSVVPRDSSVGVVVSKGPELIEVPPLVGATLEAAQAKLQALGFEVDTVSYLPGRLVRSTNPGAGSKVGRGTKVTLTF